MKRFLLSLVILSGCISASAQKVLEDDYFKAIPSMFTYDHTPYVVLTAGNDHAYVSDITIYDTKLNQIASLSSPVGIEDLDIECYVDKNGFLIEPMDDIYLTQTFFNDDADWEYIEEVNVNGVNEDVTIAYAIKKLDGTVLGSISSDIWDRNLYIINDEVYTALRVYSDDQYTYNFYTIPEFRKLLFETDDIKPVPAMTRTVSKEAYDLMGRKVTGHHKGFVVTEGKKSLVR